MCLGWMWAIKAEGATKTVFSKMRRIVQNAMEYQGFKNHILSRVPQGRGPQIRPWHFPRGLELYTVSIAFFVPPA